VCPVFQPDHSNQQEGIDIMTPESFKLTVSDNTDVHVYRWIPDNPVAVVQIAHGMAEHAARYADFAQALVDAGYAVYANDHRGHGKTAGSLDNVGFFGDSNGWDRVVQDMRDLHRRIRSEHVDCPFFLFGHSMGSFLVRNYIFGDTRDVCGAILSGTGQNPKLLVSAGKLVAKWEARRKGPKAKSRLMNNMSFGSFNKPFRPNRTDFDWLSRDDDEVDKYIADPFCGDVFTAGFFVDMMTGLQTIAEPENIRNIRRDLPIFLFSGENDPVGNNGKAIRQVYEIYRNAGIRDVTYRLYENGRHEMLNEINRQEVYADVIAWMDDHR
jgi:alpha-beta hydrolase superfamily lysophospholipase